MIDRMPLPSQGDALKRRKAHAYSEAKARADALARLAKLPPPKPQESTLVGHRRELVETLLKNNSGDAIRCAAIARLLASKLLDLPGDAWAAALGLAIGPQAAPPKIPARR